MIEKKRVSLVLGAVLASSIVQQNTNAQSIDSINKHSVIEKVAFKNNQIKMVGNLFYPPNFDKNKKYPAVVITHPWVV